jgi:hypothetical protein
MASSIFVIYAVALAVGFGGTVWLSKATSRTSIRLLGGGAGGATTASLLENGGGYSFIATAWAGEMGIMGSFFIASIGFLLLVWVANLAITKTTVIR